MEIYTRIFGRRKVSNLFLFQDVNKFLRGKCGGT